MHDRILSCRNYATGSGLGQPRSEYARSRVPSSDYAREARCNVYDDIDLADDEIAQKLKEMRPRKVFTVESDDDVEDEQDKVGLIQTLNIFLQRVCQNITRAAFRDVIV